MKPIAVTAGLYATSFVCGATVMGLEILGFRLLPPHVGYSLPVWGSVLGVLMVALSLGYWAGGVLADRRPAPRTLYVLVLVAAVGSGWLLLGQPRVLGVAASLGVVPGSLVAAALLLAVPVAALGAVSPIIVRLLVRDGRVGRAAGTVYAVSTLGGIVGTLLTSFYLVPVLGTRASLAGFVAALAVVGGLGLGAVGRSAPGSPPTRLPTRPILPLRPRPAAAVPGAGARSEGLAGVRVDRARVGAACLGLGLVSAGFSLPVVFELIGRDQARWAERFAGGQDEAVTGPRDGRVPYLLPGPADGWAGGKPHRVRIEFTAPAGAARLVLDVPDADRRAAPALAVAVNGREVGELRLRPGSGRDPAAPRAGPSLEYSLAIPAAAFGADGLQTLTITNRAGGWVKLSRVALLSAAPTFAAAHYLDPSPPPGWALLAFAIALVALWRARPEVERKSGSLRLILSAGLGLLAFLYLASTPVLGHWHVVLVTHRASWLLLVATFGAALAPPTSSLSGSGFPVAAAVLTGAAGMALEIAGFRLIAPYFGYSTYVWGAVLGVVMAALAAGYALGGWLADRGSAVILLRRTLVLTGLAVVGALYLYPAIVRATVERTLVGGSLAASAALLALPTLGLGVAAPLVTRAAVSAGAVGRGVGRIYALGTIGSVAGAIASGFVLVTRLGPQETWATAGVTLLVLVSAHGGVRSGAVAVHWLGVLLVFLQPLVPEISVAALKGGTRIYETESEYSRLEVIEVGKTLQLVPSLRFVHTIHDEERVLEPIITYGLLPSFLVDRPRTMLHLGMGGGALSRAYLGAHPTLTVAGVDIDREMVDLGKRFLGLREDPRLRIFIDDARAHLLRAPGPPYDIVVWDLFQGGVFVPYYSLTREFFELARGRMDMRGVLAVFVARPVNLESPVRREKFERLYRAVGNTLAAVYPSVFAYPVTKIGYYFVATGERTSLETVRARLDAVEQPDVQGPIRTARRGLVEYRTDPAVPVLTDDLAPVDQLVYDAFFGRRR